jgi:tRNA A37 N6-isopentenylltransferase MiaA
MASKKSQKVEQNFVCESCDYITCKKSDYNKHLQTEKHNASKMLVNASKKSQKVAKSFVCGCGKIYKHDSSYYRHKKSCDSSDTIIHIEQLHNTEISTSTEKNEIYDLVKYLMNENKELKDMMIEQQTKMMEQQNLVLEIAKNGTHNTTHTNSHNKTFNLQFFLNETCKGAMNIMDFVEQIVLNLHP